MRIHIPFIKSRYSKIENQKTLYIYKQLKMHLAMFQNYNNIFLKCYIQIFINFKEYLGRKIFFNITISWGKIPYYSVYILTLI